MDPNIPILILATSDVMYEELPNEIRNLFNKLSGSVYLPKRPTAEQRTQFFRPVFLIKSLRLLETKLKEDEVLEELPEAPELPKKLTDKEKKELYEKEEVSLRELRIFLREICAKLARNRQ